jgi:hypothetical protein
MPRVSELRSAACRHFTAGISGAPPTVVPRPAAARHDRARNRQSSPAATVQRGERLGHVRDTLAAVAERRPTAEASS